MRPRKLGKLRNCGRVAAEGCANSDFGDYRTLFSSLSGTAGGEPDIAGAIIVFCGFSHMPGTGRDFQIVILFPGNPRVGISIKKCAYLLTRVGKFSIKTAKYFRRTSGPSCFSGAETGECGRFAPLGRHSIY